MSQILSPQQEALLLVLKSFGGQISGIKRLQKLIFLSQHQGVLQARSKFIFAPYLRGPFSTDCMDTLNELSQRGYVRVRRISDNRHCGYHVVQLTEKGTIVVGNLKPSHEIEDFAKLYSEMDTDILTEYSYEVFCRKSTPTMLYINSPAIDDAACYPSSPHWRSSLGERIRLSVPISKTAALGDKDVQKLERVRNIAAVFTSTRQILSDWRVRRIVPGCIIRTYGVFLSTNQVSLGVMTKFSHSLNPNDDSIVDVLIDAFGKIFFIDNAAETLFSYVVELCGEVSVSVTSPVINALYILGYEILEAENMSRGCRRTDKPSREKNLDLRPASEGFDPTSMFT